MNKNTVTFQQEIVSVDADYSSIVCDGVKSKSLMTHQEREHTASS